MNTGTPTFSLAYTSVRPALVPQIVKLWNDRSKNKDHEWCISVDAGNEPTRAAVATLQAAFQPGEPPIALAINEGRKNCVDGWNAAAAITKGKVIIAVADDFLPPPNWDEALLALQPGWIEDERVVHVNDGFIGHIFTLAILTRKRYDRFGYLWYPGYESMFVDTEFGDVANRDGVVIEAMHLLFEHFHHANGKRPKDVNDANHENDVRWKRGEMLYNFRKQQGFPVDKGPKAESAPVETPKRVRQPVALILVDDATHLLPACQHLHGQGIKTFYFGVYDEDAQGSRRHGEFFAAIGNACQQIVMGDEGVRIPGVKVNTKIFRTEMYRFPNGTWSETDNLIQTDMLAWVRAEGHEDILFTTTANLAPDKLKNFAVPA